MPTFQYFAYGSNMLSERMHINNPTSIRRVFGYIKDHVLDFGTFSNVWKGAAATLTEKKDSIVYGTVWEVDVCHSESLDVQEGVAQNIYKPLLIDVIIPEEDNRVLQCKTYQQTKLLHYIEPSELPFDRKPSPLYLNTIINGAVESNLPDTYMQFLLSLPHNGYEGEYDINLSLK